MRKFKRIFLIVMDSFGAGNAHDAKAYGDEGADTMGHIAEYVGQWNIPNLQKLGLANLHPLKGVEPAVKPLGYYALLNEKSRGKDTNDRTLGDDGNSELQNRLSHFQRQGFQRNWLKN